MAALICEVVLTFMFLIIILRATGSRAPQAFAPIAGSTATSIHLVGIPISNLSANRGSEYRPCSFHGEMGNCTTVALLVAPFIGAALAGVAYPMIAGSQKS